MNRRLNHNTTKSPALTGGDERPRAACDWAWAPYEELMHSTRGPGFREAVSEARATCGLSLNAAGEVVTGPDTCPLLTTCLVGNDEPWARAILGEDPRKEPVQRANCGKKGGYIKHHENDEKPCKPCVMANRAASAAHAAKKRAAA